MSLTDRTGSINKRGPGSMLQSETERQASGQPDGRLPLHSPSSLLESDTEREIPNQPVEQLPLRSPSSLLESETEREIPSQLAEQLPLRSPSSLLPEEPGMRYGYQARDELAAVSPSELLPPPPLPKAPRRSRRVIAVVAGSLLVVVVALLALWGSRAIRVDPAELMADAKLKYAAGDVHATVIQLRNALQADPKHLESRLLYASILLERGEAQGAEVELRTALDMGAPRHSVMPLLGRALIAQKEYQQALDAMAPGPDEDASKQPALTLALRGHALLFLGRIEQAREAYETALTADPDEGEAWLGRARLAVLDRKQELALASSEQAVAKAPKNADALALLGDLKRVVGDEAAASAAYEKAVRIAPSAHATRLSLASIYVNSKEYDKAITHLGVVLKAVPDSPTANFLLALTDFRRDKFDDARNLAAKVLNVQGNHVPSLLMVGASAYMTRDYATAEKALARALVLAPGNRYARKMLGASLVQTKQPKRAIEALAPLLDQAAADPEVLATLGEAYLDDNEFSRATELLEKAAAMAPKHAGARIGLGKTRLAAGELDRAVADLELASTLAPRAREAKLLLAMTHVQRKEFDRAIEIIGQLERDARTNPVALNLLGVAYIGKRDFTAATRYLEQALALSPNYVPAVMNLIQIDMRERDARAAVRRLENVLMASPNNIQAMFTLAAILSDMPGRQEEALRWIERAQQASPDSAEPLLRLARFQLGRGYVKEALEAAHRGIQAKVHNVDVLDGLGQVQLAARAEREALDTYVRMVSENPKLPLAHVRLGEVQKKVGNSAGARQSYRNALELKPDYIEAKVALAQLEVQAGNTQAALSLAADLITQLPRSAVGLSVKGDILVHSKRFSEAIAAFEAAFAVQKTPALVIKLHQTHALLGKVERGEEIVDQWLQVHPKDFDTRQFVADYSLQAKRYSTAQKHYEALAEAMPNNQQVLNNLAVVYDELKDPRALQAADRAYRLNTRNSFVADTYGWMLVRLGRPERGRDILRQAIELASAVPDIRYHYAVGLAKTGQRKEARSELERAFSLRGKLTQEADAKALLEQLRN
ncbi:MAG: PEP-CTERM system TPR-repeat protein PrsT [Betaproteobacteria bacterium]|nr:PEP-CTERM system TPR-repeat protein PrsT [Betaproteobacteria bacterium]